MISKKLTKISIFVFAIAFFWSVFFHGDVVNLRVLPEIMKQKPEPGEMAASIFDVMLTKYYRADGMVESEKNKTTSESQSYAMMIAVLSEDRESFDRVLNWTKSNLQTRPKDELFSWVWQNGEVTDVNPATDADQDIAYALYLAYKEWGDEVYLNEARTIVRDIWDVETEEIAEIRYVAGGNWAVQHKDGVVVNPSYFAPYQYRVFAIFDTEHNWLSLVDSSYKALELCSGLAGLAMDWCKIDDQGNVMRNYRFGGKDSSVYSYDALRVPFRVAMDYALYIEPRALEYLKKNKVFAENWKEYGKIFAVYNQQGVSVGANESLANYGAQLASMSLTDEVIAKEIFEKKIATIDSWENVSFYDMSWLWLGLHFYAEELSKD